MLLTELVTASETVARSPGRNDKIAVIAELLARVSAQEVPIAVAFLSGDLLQRQIGVGYAALIDAPEPDQSGTRTPVLTLTEVNEAFAAIGALTGPGSQAHRRTRLAELFAQATETERSFLFRLIAGDLRQGALEGVMTEAVAKAAAVPVADVRRAHQLGGSLPEVARAALRTDREPDALKSFWLTVGVPVRPMLAASAPNIDAALGKITPAAVEWKIDGIRIQIHRDGQRVRVFTRTLDEISARVPELVELALTLNTTSAVVDGEAVALRADGRPRPFQETSARVASQNDPPGPGEPAGGLADSADPDGPDGGTAARSGGAEPLDPSPPARLAAGRVPLTAFLFDLLHVDGEDLIDAPADERFRRLVEIAPAGVPIPRLVTGDVAAATAFFADAVSRGHEGVVVKSPTAHYRAGRRGSDWIKVKPRNTLDLVILAAEWGHGRRQGWLSNLHLGARDPKTGGFVMLGKTFKGLTDAMLAWQTVRLLELAEPKTGDGGTGSDGPYRQVVRVRPELVAEIAFDGVQASRRYPGGVTLRFARVLRYRTDKTAAEADTLESVRSLWTGDEEEQRARPS